MAMPSLTGGWPSSVYANQFKGQLGSPRPSSPYATVLPYTPQRDGFVPRDAPGGQPSAPVSAVAASPSIAPVATARPKSIAPLSPTVAPIATTAIANGSIGAAGSGGLAGASGPNAGVMMPTFDFNKLPQANPFLAMTGLPDPNSGRNTPLGAADYTRRLRAMGRAVQRDWGGPQNLMQAMATGGNFQLGQQGLANQRDLGFEGLRNQRDLGFGDQSTRQYIADRGVDSTRLVADANRLGHQLNYKGTLNTNQTNQAIASGRDATSLGVANINADTSRYGTDKLAQYQQGTLDLENKKVGEQLAQGEWNREKALTPAQQQRADALWKNAQNPNHPPQVQQSYMDQYNDLMGIKRPAIPATNNPIGNLSPAMANKVRELAASDKGGDKVVSELRLSGMSKEDIERVLPLIFPGSPITPDINNPEGTVGGAVKPRGLAENLGLYGAMLSPTTAPLTMMLPQGMRLSKEIGNSIQKSLGW